MLDHSTRYSRQTRFAPIGESGQQSLAEARVLICGCGALGSTLAELLARSGVGYLRLVDRDFVELNNLQRQSLYAEQDVVDTLPKAVAAKQRLVAVNSQIKIEAHVEDITHTNIVRLAEHIDLVLDGTDNFETRLLINDYCQQEKIPWVFGGCIGAEGQVMAILPGETACFRCLVPEVPPAGSTQTCESAGVLATIVNVVASLQATEALKLLSGNRSAVANALTVIDLWGNRLRQLDLESLTQQRSCPACGEGDFPFLDGRAARGAEILCGRNAVQLSSEAGTSLDLEALAQQFEKIGKVSANPFLLRLEVDSYQFTLFRDGRTIVGGTDDITTARNAKARYLGS